MKDQPQKSAIFARFGVMTGLEGTASKPEENKSTDHLVA